MCVYYLVLVTILSQCVTMVSKWYDSMTGNEAFFESLGTEISPRRDVKGGYPMRYHPRIQTNIDE